MTASDPEGEPRLTHRDAAGQPRMVDVGQKPVSERLARASGAIQMGPQAFAAVAEGQVPKGDVLTVARLAGIQAAKRTADLIPLCHPLQLSHIDVQVTPDPDLPGLRVESTVRTAGQTGVEMEALTATSVALLAIYDMVKGVDRQMTIDGVRLEEKRGGVRGDYRRGSAAPLASDEAGS